MRRDSRSLRLPLAILVTIHLMALLAGFLAPYDPAEQNRDLAFAPPTPLRFQGTGASGFPGLGIHPLAPDPERPGAYREDSSRLYPVRLMVRGEPYRFAFLVPTRIHLFGVDEPARLFLLGSDALGRDQLSRLLYGARISLAAGLLAALASLALGTLLGAASGFFGGKVDAITMRVTEIFMALPWLYLLLAARAFLPLDLSAATAFLMLVAIIGLVGWARPARLVRGVVLAGRNLDYLTAARGLGASPARMLLRHSLPQALPVVLTQAAMLVPQYILAEVTLSFLGLGVAEPVPSWGNMLGELQRYHVLVSYWWMFLPALALVAVLLAYSSLARRLGAEGA